MRYTRVRDPRIALLMVLLGLGQSAVSQILMWTPTEAAVPTRTREGIQIIRLAPEPEPELPSPLLVASTVGGVILVAGGIGAYFIARQHEAESVARPAVEPDALVAVPPAPEDPLALDPELRALVEAHERQRPG